jgi:hypothetical protein
MRFRAVAHNFELDGHPVQVLTQDKGNVEVAAKTIARTYGVPVDVYENKEELIETVQPPK